MSSFNNTEQGESLCEQHRVWIIGYRSSRWQTPLFMIWYTDSDEDKTDRLLTDPSGNILASESLPGLISAVWELPISTQSEQFADWLASIKDVILPVQIHYDMISLTTSIADKQWRMQVLEDFTNWLNLFGDFVYQDEQNSYLEQYHRDPLLRKPWDHFYNSVFWPRYSNSGQSVRWSRPPLRINTSLFLKKLAAMVAAFDARIHLV